MKFTRKSLKCLSCYKLLKLALKGKLCENIDQFSNKKICCLSDNGEFNLPKRNNYLKYLLINTENTRRERFQRLCG